jgi:hypothetical protein
MAAPLDRARLRSNRDSQEKAAKKICGFLRFSKTPEKMTCSRSWPATEYGTFIHLQGIAEAPRRAATVPVRTTGRFAGNRHRSTGGP